MGNLITASGFEKAFQFDIICLFLLLLPLPKEMDLKKNTAKKNVRKHFACFPLGILWFEGFKSLIYF